MKKSFLITTLFALICFNSYAKGSKVDKIDGFESPESVIEYKDSFFVSNVGKKLEPSTKDGDGFISKVSKDGTILEKHFLPKKEVLNAPKGMGIIKNILYVADIDRIVGFNLDNGTMVSEISLAKTGTTFLNDIAVKDNNTLIVSSTDLGKLFYVNINKKTYTELNLKEKIAGINGIFYDNKNNTVIFNTFGDNGKKGFAGNISLNNNKIKIFKKLEGFFDGLVYKNNNILLSDWDAMDKGGKIWLYNQKNNEKKELYSGIKGNADFCYSEKYKKLWIPAMMENRVYLLPLNF